MTTEAPRHPGADVLDTVENWLSTYIRTAQDADLYVLTLWAAHTHLVTETYTSPRLLLDSPAPGAGKTTTLDHLQRLCHHPVQAASLSSPSLLARLLEKGPRTILVDEADRTLSPKMDGVGELLAVLNSGYRRGASRPVLVPDKEDGGWSPREMSTFGPVAMAGNSPDLPDDTRSRCIRVLLLPDYNGDAADSDWQFIEDDAALIHEQLTSWADDVRDEVATLRPEYPDGLRGRNRERWAPLLKVATVAGGPWPSRCLDLIADDLDDQDADREAGIERMPRHVQLLRDIAEVWPADEEFMHTPRMVDALQNYRPDWWGALNQYGVLTAQGMGRMLSSHYNVRADRLSKDTGQGRRGYYLQSFLSSWRSFGVSVDYSPTPVRKPAKPDKSTEPAGKLVGLVSKDGMAGSPETPGRTAPEPTATPTADDPEDEIVTIIHTAVADANGDGVSGGALMRAVKESTGSGSHALTVADDMVAAGLLRTDNGRYYRNEAA